MCERERERDSSSICQHLKKRNCLTVTDKNILINNAKYFIQTMLHSHDTDMCEMYIECS